MKPQKSSYMSLKISTMDWVKVCCSSKRNVRSKSSSLKNTRSCSSRMATPLSRVFFAPERHEYTACSLK